MYNDQQIPFKHYSEIRIFLYKYTQDADLITNIIQTTFIWFFENQETINKDYPLIVILKKRSLYFLQDFFAEKAKQLNNIRIEDIAKNDREEGYGLVDHQTPLSKLIDKERVEFVSALVAELSVQEQTLLLKIILGNLPYKEVAQELSISIENARLKVNRIRKKLKSKMRD